VEDFTIPEAQNRQTGGTQPAIPCSLRFGWGKVEGPIGFDHDPGLFAEEIDDKWPQRLLTTELRTVEPSIAKQSPQMPFRRSSRAPQGAGANGRGAKQARHDPVVGGRSLRVVPQPARSKMTAHANWTKPRKLAAYRSYRVTTRRKRKIHAKSRSTSQRRRYLLSFLRSWLCFVRVLRLGAIISIPRAKSCASSPSLS